MLTSHCCVSLMTIILNPQDIKNKYNKQLVISMSEMQFEIQDSLPQFISSKVSGTENTKIVPGFSTVSYCSYPEQEQDFERYSREVGPRQLSEELFEDQFGLFRAENDCLVPSEKEVKCLQEISTKDLDVKEKKEKKEKSICKNSNTIKKYGRLIIDHEKAYHQSGKVNVGIANMMKLLNRKSKKGHHEVNKRDKFNTYHLKAMLETGDLEEISHNLKVTRRILNKHLRSNVLESSQIEDQSKIVYMNTLKSCSLRCSNKQLAVRLQISNEIRT